MDNNENVKPSGEEGTPSSNEFGDSVEMTEGAREAAESESGDDEGEDGEYEEDEGEYEEGYQPSWPQSFTSYEDYLKSQREERKKRLPIVYAVVAAAFIAVFVLLMLLVFNLNKPKDVPPSDSDGGKAKTGMSLSRLIGLEEVEKVDDKERMYTSLRDTSRKMFFLPSGRFVQPWDPIDWYDLKKNPLLYKSLGEKAFDELNLYSSFLTGKDSVGFVASPYYFDVNLKLIRKGFIGKISEDRIKTCIASEARRFFREAGVKGFSENFDDLKLDSGFLVEFQRRCAPYIDKCVPPKDAEKPVNKDELANILNYAALFGLYRGLDDPYSTIMTPSEYKDMMEDLNEGTFGGIGVIIEKSVENGGALTVSEPLEGTPAFRAGLLSGDVILEIDGFKTKGLDIMMCVSKMRGPKGSNVKLKVKRDFKVFDVDIIRDDIKTVSLTHKVLPGGIGYIKLRNFASDTIDEFDLAVADIMKPSNKIKGLIVDIRNNGGGYLVAGVALASRFVPDGKVVHKQVDRKGRITSCNALSAPKISVPSVLLVNRFSASSSEILAGALKDSKTATLVGERTFGKGSVQEVIAKEVGGAVKLSIAYFLSPNDHVINKNGIRPDVSVPMSPRKVGKKDDAQLKKAVAIIESRSSGAASK